MSSDPKNYIGFLVDEISELGHTVLCVTIRTGFYCVLSLCSRHLDIFWLRPVVSVQFTIYFDVFLTTNETRDTKRNHFS